MNELGRNRWCLPKCVLKRCKRKKENPLQQGLCMREDAFQTPYTCECITHHRDIEWAPVQVPCAQ